MALGLRVLGRFNMTESENASTTLIGNQYLGDFANVENDATFTDIYVKKLAAQCIYQLVRGLTYVLQLGPSIVTSSDQVQRTLM